MRAIFLDFDGVLNNGEFLFNNISDFPNLIMEEKVTLLNDLIGRTNAKIIFSTSWREEFTFDELIRVLEKVGFKHRDKCIGVTPVQLMDTRADEIITSLRENGITKFIVLDDNAEELYGISPYNKVITNPNIGLTKEDVTEAIKMFNVQDTKFKNVD